MSPKVKLILIVILVSSILQSCNIAETDSSPAGIAQEQNFESKKIDGRWTVDKGTAMELRAMQSTIENFNLLITEQPQNLPAYQGYAIILQNHIDRTVTYCSLDKNTRSVLCKDLDKLREQISAINKGDIGQAREASKNINLIFKGLNDYFNFDF
jgi:hypothetical protein